MQIPCKNVNRVTSHVVEAGLADQFLVESQTLHAVQILFSKL